MRARVFFAALLLGTSQGCIAVFLQESVPSRITVTEIETGSPVSHAKVEVTYSYDAYAFLLTLNEPAPAHGMTDASGEVILSVADFRYRTVISVAYAHALLSREEVRAGGEFSAVSIGAEHQQMPHIRVKLERPAR
jgi:hypothetical protein